MCLAKARKVHYLDYTGLAPNQNMMTYNIPLYCYKSLHDSAINVPDKGLVPTLGKIYLRLAERNFEF